MRSAVLLLLAVSTNAVTIEHKDMRPPAVESVMRKLNEIPALEGNESYEVLKKMVRGQGVSSEFLDK